MSTLQDYTIGWICAVKVEYVAARQFLDKEHVPPSSIPAQDNNTYTLGNVGSHNVVITVLPRGENGIASAASALRHMLRSFTSIRFGLMVGIGGGAPSLAHDIRLGDVVVGCPTGDTSGVFHYNHGKTIQDRKFHHTGWMNSAPRSLRTKVADLEARHESDGHEIAEAVDEILCKKPRLRQMYGRRDPNEDRLYQSHHVHSKKRGRDCIDVCGNEASKLVTRSERTADENNPAIHYGLVASSDHLMQDALLRDNLVEERDVLCFEMQAAGLMNDFPCLVVRGICNYSDTHKNDLWQGYAAMTAAAYAKELLKIMPLDQVKAEQKAIDMLGKIMSNVEDICSTTKKTHDATTRLHLDNHQEKITLWLSAPDPSRNQIEAMKRRCKGTSRWFLESSIFSSWKSTSNSFLWLYGIPGCGKTILSSTIIDSLCSDSTSSQVILYFYFDFSDTAKQSLNSMLRSFISQLYHSQPETRVSLDQLFTSHHSGSQQPTPESLSLVLDTMARQIGDVLIIIDALDESRTKQELLKWISEVVGSKSGTKIIVTARETADIRSAFSKWARPEDMISVRHDDINVDIQTYVRNILREDVELERWHSQLDVQEEIETKLMEKADGMFRWASCQLDVLKHCLDLPDLRRALAALPETLDETYSRILGGIPERQLRKAIILLQFLTWSERPLRLDEAVDALTVDPDETPGFDARNRLSRPEEISKICSGLVVLVTKETPYSDETFTELQLAHFSVKEYLMSIRVVEAFKRPLDEVNARSTITNVCLTYLSCLEHDLPVERIRAKFPFAQYSARYWTDHARIVELSDANNTRAVLKYFNMEKRVHTCCSLLWNQEYLRECSSNQAWPQAADPLYYASLAGLARTVQYLLQHGASVNTPGKRYGNALQAASAWGYQQIVQTLLDNNANVNAQGGYYGNALQAALAGGHKQIVQILLDNDADVNAQGGAFGNALNAASFKGDEQIVRLLLKNNTNVNAQSDHFGTALQIACRDDRRQIVQVLIDAGAEVNAYVDGPWGGTALVIASSRGHKQAAEMLLKSGANIHGKGVLRSELVLTLYEKVHQASVTFKRITSRRPPGIDKFYENALFKACENGHESTAQMLLENGAQWPEEVIAAELEEEDDRECEFERLREKVAQRTHIHLGELNGESNVAEVDGDASDTRETEEDQEDEEL